MKIKSVSDVITNSSSEVFAIINQGSIDDLKKMISGILKMSGSEKTCDDFFNIYMVPPSDASDYYEDEKPWEELTQEEKLAWCVEKSNESYEYWYLYPEVNITPKIKDIPSDLLNLLERAVGTGLSDSDAAYC